MPIYEYECPKCQKVIEMIQKFSDPPLTTCPTCQGAVKKKMSLTSFQLKGTGWYATDYKKSDAKKSSTSAPTDTAAKSDPAPATPPTPAKKDSDK